MKKQAVFSHAAHEDLLDIWCYIVKDNPEAADRLEADVRAEVELIATQPTLGHRRLDLTPRDVWFHNIRKTYLVVYQITEHIEIVRVLHGARDVRQLLDE